MGSSQTDLAIPSENLILFYEEDKQYYAFNVLFFKALELRLS